MPITMNAPMFAPQAPANAATAKKPPAEFWLNFGYVSAHQDEDGTYRFVSLPLGIPVDTQDMLPTNSRNQGFAQFQAARNDLLEQLLAVSKTLKPGEEKVICQDPESGLAVQLRRVNTSTENNVPAGDNPFAKILNLAS